jgi:hypothetical protein
MTTRIARALAIIRDALLILIMVLFLVMAGRLAAAVDEATQPEPAQPCLIDPQSEACLGK